MAQRKILVGGKWITGHGEMIRSINPADGALITEFRGAGAADVDAAVQVGRAAMNDESWRDLKPHERAEYLHRIASAILANAADLAQLQTADTGKCLSETHALVRSAAATFRYMAAALETLEDVVTPSRGDYLTMSIHEPIGVVGAITPWNSPIASDAQKVAPALAAGNAVLLKPAEWSSLVALELGRICLDSGLPKGLISVLPGKGSVVGAAIVEHPGIRKISFTGGTETGQKIAVAAASKLMPVSLELGGKSATIVLADADPEHAINGVLFGIFSSTGQSCIAGSRLFVARELYPHFIDRLVERTRSLRVGLPTESTTQVAPLISVEHRDHVASYVDLARDADATVLCGGEIPAGQPYEDGAFYLPTVLSGLDNQARVCQEEIFGPVLIVLPFDDEEDLVHQVNDSIFGLACGIWSADYKKAYQIARRVDAGTVWINTYKQLSIATPFGGFKASGIGREKGRAGIRAYMQQKSIYWGMNSNPLPWAD